MFFFLKVACPNITGSVQPFRMNTYYPSSSGALTYDALATLGYATAGAIDTTGKVTIDASKSNSIYGKSNTVQPPSLILNYAIKY